MSPNSKQTWMTARVGDAVVLKGEKGTEPKRYFIEAVMMFRVFPVEFNGMAVETTQPVDAEIIRNEAS